MDAGTLANVASIIGSFGAAMLYFRLQRELYMREKGEISWLAAADWLLIASTLLSLLGVVVPLASGASTRIPATLAGTAAILVSGYIFAILAHYRIVFGQHRAGSRENPEPIEALFIGITIAGAVGYMAWSLFCVSF